MKTLFLNIMKEIIALAGLPGAGKTEAAKFFTEKGFFSLRFGDVTDDALKEKGLEKTEKNEKEIRVQLRKELGMDAYAKLNIPKIKEHEKVVIDGLRSYQEFTTLKEEFGEAIKLLAIKTPDELRFSRLSQRKIRPLTKEECIARDYQELHEQNVKETLENTKDWINNSGTFDDLKEKIATYLQKIN